MWIGAFIKYSTDICMYTSGTYQNIEHCCSSTSGSSYLCDFFHLYVFWSPKERSLILRYYVRALIHCCSQYTCSALYLEHRALTVCACALRKFGGYDQLTLPFSGNFPCNHMHMARETLWKMASNNRASMAL